MSAQTRGLAGTCGSWHLLAMEYRVAEGKPQTASSSCSFLCRSVAFLLKARLTCAMLGLRTTSMLACSNKCYKERLSIQNVYPRGAISELGLRSVLEFLFFINVNGSNLFSTNDSSQTRSNSAKVRCRQVQLDRLNS